MIRKPQDIFNLDYSKIINLEGWGNLSMNNLKTSIENSKKVSLQRFIYSLGIRHIGLENAKLLSKYFVSFSKFKNLSKTNNYEDLLNIDGIGETQVNSIKGFFRNEINLKVLNELEKVLKIESRNSLKNGILKSKTFMITGKLNGISRAEVKSLIEKNSGITLSTVSKNLNFLVVGDKPTKKKLDQAKKFGVKIISQDGLKKLLN